MGAITVSPCRIQYSYVESVLDYGLKRRMYADTSKNEATWCETLDDCDHTYDTAYLLATCFGTLKQIAKATEVELSHIEGIGPIIGKSVAEWFKDVNNRALLARLEKHLKVAKVVVPSKGPLTGQTVVITGTLPTLSREEAEARVRRAGGKAANSVSSKTSFVVAGDPPAGGRGSKLAKAEQLGVSVVSEAEFLKKLEA